MRSERKAKGKRKRKPPGEKAFHPGGLIQGSDPALVEILRTDVVAVGFVVVLT